MSDTMNLIPTDAFRGYGSDALSAAAGAFFGSWFGNGAWGGNGWGNRGGWGYPDGAIANAAVGVGVADAVMDRLNTIDGNVDRLTISDLQNAGALQKSIGESTYALSNAVNDGYARMTNDLNSQAFRLQNTGIQGFAGLNATVNSTSAQTNNILAQGFSGINTAIRDNGYETRLNIKDLQASQADCCCGIKNAILGDGAMTRALIQSNYINELQTKLCDAKAHIASLENQAFTAKSNAIQTKEIIDALKTE